MNSKKCYSEIRQPRPVEHGSGLSGPYTGRVVSDSDWVGSGPDLPLFRLLGWVESIVWVTLSDTEWINMYLPVFCDCGIYVVGKLPVINMLCDS